MPPHYHGWKHLSRVIQHHFLRRIRAYFVGVVSLLVVCGVWIYVVPPAHFPTDARIEVASGLSASEVGRELYKQHIISSSFFFHVTARIFGLEKTIQSGTYQFERPLGLAQVLYRLMSGISGLSFVKVTIPEGFTRAQIAQVYQQSLPHFNVGHFMLATENDEGYLFPNTYLFFEDTNEKEVIRQMKEEFYKKINFIQKDIDSFGRSVSDIVILASLLEREARTINEKRIIADILWRRLDAKHLLQVDAVFGYIKERETYHPSLSDLDIDSPYNTYKHIGLPPTPIANPGIESLLASVTPLPNEYWYYLTGSDGTMYYAKTFEEHKTNKARYLK